MRTKIRCACGLPLHYSDPTKEKEIDKLSEELGEFISVNICTSEGNEKYLVQRHFIELHGLKAKELPALLKQRIVRRDI